MKRFAVYGTDTTKAMKEFDNFEDAKEFAKKGLRKWAKTVKDREIKKTVYWVSKNNNGMISEKYFN